MLTSFYRKLPDNAQKLISPLVMLIRILKEFIFDVYMLSGETEVLYITSHKINPYFIEKICRNAEITRIKRIHLWEIKRLISQQDAVLLDMHKSFAHFFDDASDDAFLVPQWVRQILDLDKIVKIERRDLRKISKYGFEVRTDPEALKFFYDEMYVPYAKKKYADGVLIESFNSLRKVFKKGELMFIKLNDKYISGSLGVMTGDVYTCWVFGVLDENYVKEGALFAIYYFEIQRAKERNTKIIDFGLSRPFLSDGVLRHKRQWGTRICEDKTINRIFYMKKVCKEPFICMEDGKLRAVVFSENDPFIKEFATSGLEFKICHLK